MLIVFTITVFLAAALLFGVQPMVAKALLPSYGGGSGVWTTCMLFYQGMLIVGYVYAHVLLTRVPRRRQFWVHGAVLALAVVMGWVFSRPTPPPVSEFPVVWLLGQLFLISGLPYFAISSAGPLLQGWFARTGHARAHDPYFLYAASNAGSFVGLLAYPFVFEPTLGLDQQRAMWLVLFAVFGALALVCLRRTTAERFVALRVSEAAAESSAEAVGWRRRLLWLFLAFVPSSTLLGVTTHITTDVAAFPLLWVIPLALYLFTMIVAFSGRAASIVRSMARPMVMAIITAIVLLIAEIGMERMAPMWASIGVQFVVLLTVGLYGHARLAADRPGAARLTEFYLVMSVGGALGGLFNGVVAPLLFDHRFEYHVALLCALLMLPRPVREAGVGLAKYWARRLVIPALALGAWLGAVLSSAYVADPLLGMAIWLIPPGVLIYMGWRDRLAAAGAFVFPAFGVVMTDLTASNIILRERTFYGIHVVSAGAVHLEDRLVRVHSLTHGTTVHGKQFMADPELSGVPLGYYHPDGPCGGMLRVLRARHEGPLRLGLVGLGTGAMAAHARPGDELVFFEIDPAIERIARDPGLFTYLADSRGQVDVRLGDGRLLLEASRDAGEAPFDLLVIDAFSSDAIPTHLLTTEAVRLYFDRVAPDGMVAVHISNRHLDLWPLVYELGLQVQAFALMSIDSPTPEQIEREQRFSSVWVVLTRSSDAGNELLGENYIYGIPHKRIRPWTDQYSNLLSVIDY